MRNLILRNDMFEDLFDIRRDFDQMLNRMMTRWPWGQEKPLEETPFVFAPAVESYLDKDGKKYFCRISLPGIDPKDIQIHVQGNLLTISGERKTTRTSKALDYFEQEFTYGSFERKLTLPDGVNTEKLFAEYVNGVLEITAPVAAAALPRRVEIKVVPISKQMAA